MIGAGEVNAVMPTAGQSAGGIRGVLPAGEILRRIVAEAEEALGAASGSVSRADPPRSPP